MTKCLSVVTQKFISSNPGRAEFILEVAVLHAPALKARNIEKSCKIDAGKILIEKIFVSFLLSSKGASFQISSGYRRFKISTRNEPCRDSKDKSCSTRVYIVYIIGLNDTLNNMAKYLFFKYTYILYVLTMLKEC
jgi:hypothetical protein